jgi:hypothetical protein
MKRRNREINIFNLSMMDVISGAMGAFLIILIIFSRYYRSDPLDSKSIKELTQELQEARETLQEIEKMIKGGANIRELLEKLKETQQLLAQAENRVEDLKDKLDQADSQIKRLEKDVDYYKDQADRLKNRLPYIVLAAWNCPVVDIDIYLENDATSSTTKQRMTPFNPNIQQWSYWSGDEYIDTQSSPGSEVWMVRDVIPEVKGKIFYKMMGYSETTPECIIVGGIYHSNSSIVIPNITLSGQTPWVLVGIYTHQEDGKIDFRIATEQERLNEKILVTNRLEAEKRKAIKPTLRTKLNSLGN